jgi:hypothetical protein
MKSPSPLKSRWTAVLSQIALSMLVLPACARHEGSTSRDLSAAFDAATGPITWDGSAGFPAVDNQNPIGACQSFSMAAFLDYIYYWQSNGSIQKLSEKYITYSLLQLMIDDFWDPQAKKYKSSPALGAGVASVLIDAVTRSGIMPDKYYPWGDLSANDPDQFVDSDVLKKVFDGDKPESDTHTPYENRTLLNKAMLYPPPANFHHTIKWKDYATGKDMERVITNPMDLLAFARISKDRFTVSINKELAPYGEPITPDDLAAVVKVLQDDAVARHVASHVVGRTELRQAIIDSLERHMVVLLASEVWVGDWLSDEVVKGKGGHGLVVVGYEITPEGKTFFKLRKSWGDKVAADGYNFVEDEVLLPNVNYIATYK